MRSRRCPKCLQLLAPSLVGFEAHKLICQPPFRPVFYDFFKHRVVVEKVEHKLKDFIIGQEKA
jgi:hypothetical protein